MKGGVKKIIVRIRKGKSETFSHKRKTKFWEKGRETKNKGEEPRGESDFCRAFESSKFR